MAELSDKDIEFIKDLREKREENSISRRGALALLGGGAIGAGGVLGGNEVMGSAKADASTSDTDGNVGTPSNPVDAYLEGLSGPTGDVVDVGSSLVPDTDAGYDLGSSSNAWNNAHIGSLSTDKQTINHGLIRGRSGERIDASKFDGTDADARLDSALSAANDGDVIYAENAFYSASRTIDTFKGFIVGSFGVSQNSGFVIDSNWTLSDWCHLSQAAVADNGYITINTSNINITTVNLSNTGGTITVSGDRAMLNGIRAGEVTFESGTADGVIDSSTNVTVTDNGSNTVGDVA